MEDRDLIFNKLKNIISDIKPDIAGKISYDSNIADDLGFSSFEIFVLVYNVEEKLNVEIAIRDVKNNLNIKNFIKLISTSKPKQ